MNPFIERHKDSITGVLSCFERVVITGTLPDICYDRAMAGNLSYHEIRIFDYRLRALARQGHASYFSEDHTRQVSHIRLKLNNPMRWTVS